MKEYRGIIVEESLDDNRILNDLDIKKMKITRQSNPTLRWHMYEVLVDKTEIEKLSKHIIGDWYMHFWHERDIIAIFKDLSFEFNYDDRSSWNDVLTYGRELGLKEAELDFPIQGL